MFGRGRGRGGRGRGGGAPHVGLAQRISEDAAEDNSVMVWLAFACDRHLLLSIFMLRALLQLPCNATAWLPQEDVIVHFLNEPDILCC